MGKQNDLPFCPRQVLESDPEGLVACPATRQVDPFAWIRLSLFGLLLLALSLERTGLDGRAFRATAGGYGLCLDYHVRVRGLSGLYRGWFLLA